MNTLKFTIAALFVCLHLSPSATAQEPDGFNPNASDGTVYSLATQADGKILVGGDFTTIGGLTRNRIARLNADGSLDSYFNPNADNAIKCMAVQTDGKILVGGDFWNIGGSLSTYLARLNVDGTCDDSFDEYVHLGTVNSIAPLADGKVLVAGNQFLTSTGNRSYGIARFNANGSPDDAFSPNVGDGDTSTTVRCLAVQADGKIIIGGSFTTIAGAARTGIARLNANGSLDSGFNPNANGSVGTLALQADGKILILGGFTTIGGVARTGFARLNADGTLDGGFKQNTINANSLAVQADGRILISGSFTTIGGVARNRIARINADGSLDSGFNPNANNMVSSLAVQADGRILVGGNFTIIGGLTRRRIGRLNNDISAVSNLSVTGTNGVDWTRSGSAPEVSQVRFERWNGSGWISLGNASRVSGGWRVSGLSLPASGWVRAAGRTSGGLVCGSSGSVVESITYGSGSFPDIALEAPTGTSVSNGSGALAFSSIASGQFSDRAVTVHNTGGIALTSISAAITGTDAGQFALFTTPPTSLAAGASAAFTIRFSPTSLGPKTATLSIASNDPDESPFIVNLTGTGATSEAIFNGWTGLSGQDAAPDATPFGDGVENILKYAFNMNAGGPDVSVLTPGGSSGLPQVSLDQSGPQPVLRVEFLRRKGSGLIYTPQRSTTLGSFVPMTSTQTVTSINEQWERVAVEEAAPPATTSSSFARVEVRLP